MPLKTPNELQPIPDYGTLFTAEEFKNSVKGGWIVDDDGSGYYSNGKEYSYNLSVIPSKIASGGFKKQFSHVIWFNK